LVLQKEHVDGERTDCDRRNGGNLALGALDEMEPDLRHLEGLIAAFRILGEADDSIEPVAISSLALCARDAGGTRAKLAHGHGRLARDLIVASQFDLNWTSPANEALLFVRTRLRMSRLH
jgi:hypothetical protein